MNSSQGQLIHGSSEDEEEENWPDVQFSRQIILQSAVKRNEEARDFQGYVLSAGIIGEARGNPP